MSASSSESVPPAVECFSDLPEPAKKRLKTMRARVIHAMSLWRRFDHHQRQQAPANQQHREKRAELKRNSRAKSTLKGLLCCTGIARTQKVVYR